MCKANCAGCTKHLYIQDMEQEIVKNGIWEHTELSSSDRKYNMFISHPRHHLWILTFQQNT